MTLGGVKKICREKMKWIALQIGRCLRYKSEKKEKSEDVATMFYLVYNYNKNINLVRSR